jgi:hypothetical protein
MFIWLRLTIVYGGGVFGFGLSWLKGGFIVPQLEHCTIDSMNSFDTITFPCKSQVLKQRNFGFSYPLSQTNSSQSDPPNLRTLKRPIKYKHSLSSY